MAQFSAMSHNVQVNGETVLSVIDGVGPFKSSALKILANNGIADPKPGDWYSHQSWLNAFKEIAETIGENTLYSIGKKIPENASFPPEIDSIDKALGAIDMAYHMNHRGGEIGNYKYEKTGDRSARIVSQDPCPCAFDRGIIEAIATVKHDDSAPCRTNGAESCTYVINW